MIHCSGCCECRGFYFVSFSATLDGFISSPIWTHIHKNALCWSSTTVGFITTKILLILFRVQVCSWFIPILSRWYNHPRLSYTLSSTILAWSHSDWRIVQHLYVWIWSVDVPCVFLVKAYIRRHSHELHLDENPVYALLEVTVCITGEKAQGWFRHAGYITIWAVIVLLDIKAECMRWKQVYASEKKCKEWHKIMLNGIWLTDRTYGAHQGMHLSPTL